MTPRLLTNICFDLSSGRGVWAMLRINEYLEPHDRLHIALAKKAFPDQASLPKAVRRIVHEGARLSELSTDEQIAALSLDQGNQFGKKRFIKLDMAVRNRPHHERKAMRRLCNRPYTRANNISDRPSVSVLTKLEKLK